jgi:hypothetical protein
LGKGFVLTERAAAKVNGALQKVPASRPVKRFLRRESGVSPLSALVSLLTAPDALPRFSHERMADGMLSTLVVLVSQFEFREWTPDNHLLHSRFVALRDDKKAREVKRKVEKEL